MVYVFDIQLDFVLIRWKAFKELDKDLKKQKKFNEAKVVALVVKKAVESSYH